MISRRDLFKTGLVGALAVALGKDLPKPVTPSLESAWKSATSAGATQEEAIQNVLAALRDMRNAAYEARASVQGSLRVRFKGTDICYGPGDEQL